MSRLRLGIYAREDCRDQLRGIVPDGTDEQLDVLIDAVIAGINMDRPYTDRPRENWAPPEHLDRCQDCGARIEPSIDRSGLIRRWRSPSGSVLCAGEWRPQRPTRYVS